MHLYTAAAAMRARWRSRLRLAGAGHELPDLFSRELEVPPPDAGFGEPCLDAVAERFADGRAGITIRGADAMFARLVSLAFDAAERTLPVAPAG